MLDGRSSTARTLQHIPPTCGRGSPPLLSPCKRYSGTAEAPAATRQRPAVRPRTAAGAPPYHKTEAQRSGFGFERRSIGATELSGLPGSEGYGDCDDAGVWDAFFWRNQKKAPQGAATALGCTKSQQAVYWGHHLTSL